MRVKRPTLLVACVLTAACGSGEDGGERFTVVDSAGVQIVESARPGWDPGDAWRMSDEPTLSIGARKGKAPYLFNGAVSGRRLGDGRIVVADRGSSQLRFFDPAGRFLSSAGGEGDGPGEFRYIMLLWTLPGDTLAVTDNRRGLSLFDPQGAYIRSLGHLGEQAVWQGQPMGQLDDGTILAHAGSGFSPRPGEVIPTTVRLLRAAPGDSARELRTIPQARIWGFQMANFNSAMPRAIPFSSAPAFAASGEHFYVADGPEPEVRVWRGDGSLWRIVRWSMEPETVGQDLIERYREHLAGTAGTS